MAPIASAQAPKAPLPSPDASGAPTQEAQSPTQTQPASEPPAPPPSAP